MKIMQKISLLFLLPGSASSTLFAANNAPSNSAGSAQTAQLLDPQILKSEATENAIAFLQRTTNKNVQETFEAIEILQRESRKGDITATQHLSSSPHVPKGWHPYYSRIYNKQNNPKKRAAYNSRVRAQRERKEATNARL